MMKSFQFMLFLLLPAFLFSGEFVATVSSNQVNIEDTITLNLTLKEASTKQTPNIDVLKTNFSIHSQQQSSSTVIMNGKFSSSMIWRIVLTPKKDGELLIPSIKIETSEGAFASNPIKINVTKARKAESESSITNSISINTYASTSRPYYNEPFFYTVKLASKIDVANISMQPFTLEDAILEMNGEPKVYNAVEGGVSLNVIEFHYLITPLKAGPLNIPATAIQGGIVVKTKPHNGSFFDGGFSSFFGGYEQLKPFTLMTNQMVIDVEPSVKGIQPWLPAKSLKIEEVLDDGQKLRVGEPFTRSITITAEGIIANHLPNLSSQQTDIQGFKVYADKPDLETEIFDGKIHSLRHEQYTFIPQKEGELTLPEISITWWNVTEKKAILSRIAQKTFHVLPRLESDFLTSISSETEIPPVATETHSEVLNEHKEHNILLYLVVGGLAALLGCAVIWGVMLQKKIARMTEPRKTLKTISPVKTQDHSKKTLSKVEKPIENHKKPIKKEKRDKQEKLPDLNPT